MANFCVKNDFVGDINVPSDFLNSSRFDAFLAKFEKQVLVEMLGYDLYKAFIAGLAATIILQKWQDLRF
jgi:hypothetical protein